MKKALFFSGIALLLYSIPFIFMFPKNQGAYFLALMGAALFFYSIFRERIMAKSRRGILKFIRITVVLGFGIVFASFILFCVSVAVTATHVLDDDKDALIVLGAGLRGDTVSKTLACRLNAAVWYYNENSDTVIVVSGGQGSDEPVSEAFAMRQYLILRGVSENSILLEDKSTSTAENFKFSKAMLDDYFNGGEYTSAYVTNSFHCLRAGKYAKMAGLEADFLPAWTPAPLLPAYCARDFLGNLYFAVFE